MKNICKMFGAIYDYEGQLNYLTYVEGLILPDGSKDTIMRDGLNNILVSRERDKKVQAFVTCFILMRLHNFCRNRV